LFEKEKDTKVEDLINRLCTLRGIDLSKLKKLKILDDVGKKVDVNKTVGESGLPFIEIIDKSTLKEQKKTKEQDKHTIRERPSSVKITIGQNCYLPLEDQLFDDEKAALHTAKQFEVSKNFSDEFIMATLFLTKFDQKRTEEFLKNSLAFRKEKGFVNLPKLSDINLKIIDINNHLPGARDKFGRGVRYVRMNKIFPNSDGQTVENFVKWAVWYHYVGIFHDGIDALRNGICIVSQLEDLGWKNFDLDFQRQMAPIWTERFPVLMRKFVVLNPPAIFSALRKIFSAFLKAKVMERMEIVQMKDLGKLIEPDQLIAEFGGNVNFTTQDWCKNLREWAERCEERLTAPGRE